MEDKESKEKAATEHTYDNGFHPRKVTLKNNYNFYPKNIFYKFGHFLTALITRFFLIFPKLLFWGFKTKGRKYKKYAKGALLCSNHTHPVDALIIGSSFLTKMTYFTTLQSNLGFPIISRYFRLGGAVPIPEDPKLTLSFHRQTIKTLERKKENILFYPEAALIPFSDHLRPFHQGIFHYASDDIIILPILLTYHKPKGLYKLTRRKKPCIHLNYLPPYKVEKQATRKETINKASNDLFKIMDEYYKKESDYFYKDGILIKK